MSQLPYIPYNSANSDYAKQNRKAMAYCESRLRFMVLKDRPLGYKRIRQKMIGSYIVDFYCAKLMLGIEIEGSSHDDKQDYDEMRSKVLRDYGVKIIRYTNDQVSKYLEEVFESIVNEVRDREEEIRKGF